MLKSILTYEIKKHYLFGDFPILDTREREVIYNEIEDKENEIDKYFNNDLNIDIYIILIVKYNKKS